MAKRERKKDREDGQPKRKEQQQYTQFSRVYEEARRLDGMQIKPEELLDSGEMFLIHNYITRRSKFQAGKEYVAVEIEYQGARRFFFSASQLTSTKSCSSFSNASLRSETMTRLS